MKQELEYYFEVPNDEYEKVEVKFESDGVHITSGYFNNEAPHTHRSTVHVPFDVFDDIVSKLYKFREAKSFLDNDTETAKISVIG